MRAEIERVSAGEFEIRLVEDEAEWLGPEVYESWRRLGGGARDLSVFVEVGVIVYGGGRRAVPVHAVEETNVVVPTWRLHIVDPVSPGLPGLLPRMAGLPGLLPVDAKFNVQITDAARLLARVSWEPVPL